MSSKAPGDTAVSPGAFGVLLLRHDDPAAPFGCAGLGDRDGTTLLHRSLRLLAEHVSVVVVLAPADLRDPVRDLVDRVGARVVILADDPAPTARDLLAAVPGDRPTSWMIVHEPVFAQVPAGLLGEMTARGETDDLDAVIPVRPVTDTLKQVDEVGRIIATVDRERYRALSTPQLYRIRALPEDLLFDRSVPDPGTGQIGAGTETLVTRVRAASGRVALVPAPPGLVPVGPTSP